MGSGLLQLGQVLLTFGVMLGPIVGLMLLLNHRDRRQAALLNWVWQLTPRALRDLIAIEVRSPLFSRRVLVAVDMRACSREEIWEAIARWCPGLPPYVRLLVEGRMDRGLPAGFTIETACRPALCCPPRPSAAAA
jgi:hypothetical protein